MNPNTDYSEVLKAQQQQQQPQSQSQQGFSGTQQFIEQGGVREQVRSKLANGLGSLSEAASTTGIPEQAAHEIVSRAYRSW
jgi:hypothetical protein